MKMKRIIKLGLILTFFACLASCKPSKTSVINEINEKTGVTIPSNSEMIFNISDNVFMHGRLARYSVFLFNEYQLEFLTDNNFSTELPENFENRFEDEIDKCYTITRDDIKKEYMPDFKEDNQYLYLEEIAVFFIYNNKTNKLIVFIIAL